jgi:tRNA nucleotidyltransferase/poly(A) polymerase
MGRQSTPATARAAALEIVRTLRSAGHIAYFAGGCVRDELLGLSPTDYDVATDATPERIRALFKRTNEVGEAFGVVLVTLAVPEGGPQVETVEVATFRTDGPYTDKRRPDSVTFGSAEQDARRRDFTINALFLDPLQPSEPGSQVAGRVIDLVNGRPDLGSRIIRAVGDPDARLSEDHLRALRAVRLAARLAFTIEPATAAAITRHTSDLRGVSRERIGEEMRRMFAHPSRAAAATLLEELRLDAPVLEEPPKRRSGSALSNLPTSSLSYPTCLAAWALDRGLALQDSTIDALVRRYRSALCLSNDERDELAATLRALAILETKWTTLRISGQKRLAGRHPGFPGGLALFTARNPAAAEAVKTCIEALKATPSGLCPEPLLTGDDLVAAGWKPGPAFKQLLEDVYDAQLEDRVRTPAEAMELAGRFRV